MTGSTLYRRLPNGSWASEREDLAAGGSDDGPDEPAGPAAVAAPVAVGASAAAAQASAAPSGAGGAPPAGPPQQTIARPTPPSKPRRKRWGFLRILRWAVGAYVAWWVFLMIYAGTSLTKVDASSPDPIAETSGSVWLLVGSDSREGLTAKQQRRLRTGNTEGKRTDTIMLVHQEFGQAPTLVSIPRDSWVTIPEHIATDGELTEARGGKINSAFAYGGAPLLAETIEYNTGLHVDHYMEVGFAGIVYMTDAVGGIDACFEDAVTDQNSGLDVEAGCTTLDGPQSLAWVRMRYADPKGDLGRIERQQQYMASMVDEIVSVQTVLNPVRQWRIVNAVLDSVVVGEGTGMFNLGSIGFGMARIATGGGEVTTVPIDDSDHWENGQWVIKWDTAESDQLFSSMGGHTPQASVDQ